MRAERRSHRLGEAPIKIAQSHARLDRLAPARRELCPGSSQPSAYCRRAAELWAAEARQEPTGSVTTLDLDDTSRCPLGTRCESCGLESARLCVYTCECALGIMCLTMCPSCGQAIGNVNIALPTAEKLVTQHACHLGVTVADLRPLQSVDGRPQAGRS